MMRQAIERAPGDWKLRYGLAVVQAAASRDPRPAVQRLERMNPRELLTRIAVESFSGDDPQRWRAQAEGALLPFP
jgi:hypothetical protein